MAKESSMRVSRSGTYVVKAAESPPSKIVSRNDGRTSRPTTSDKRAANALLKSKRG
jgi:hypothetical protein